MLPSQQQFELSEWSGIYDVVVPKNNMLRRINELVDFTFILEELKSRYSLDNGRTAICPIRLFKYLLLKSIFELSDVDVVERAQYDMSFKYFLGYAPDAKVIDPSTLTKFRRQRLDEEGDLLNLLIQKTVQIALEKQLIKKGVIIIDATHSNARYKSKSVKLFLQEKTKQLRQSVYKYDESLKERFPDKPSSDDLTQEIDYTKDLLRIIEEKTTMSQLPTIQKQLNLVKEFLDDCEVQSNLSDDRDAKTGYKSADYSFFGYKTHLAMTDERIITAAVITSGDKADGNYLADLVDKTESSGLKIEHVIADAAYSARKNIDFTKKKNIRLVSKLHPRHSDGHCRDDRFTFVKDADRYMCPAGHLSKTPGRYKVRKDNHGDQIKYFFDIEICKVCPLRDGCYKEGAKTKSYSISIPKKVFSDQKEYESSDEFKELSRLRYKIEAKNSELKNAHGYKKAIASGLFGMTIQAATTIFAVNMKRIITLIDQE